MGRRGWGLVMILLGAALIVVSLGQYGYMAWSQHKMREQFQRRWEHMDRPAAGSPALRSRATSLELVIPSIHLDDVVVRGTSYEDLLVAPGLLEGTPLPSEGGNTVIAGHRDTFFRHVADLKPGDLVEVRSGDRKYEYQVTARQVVKPTEVSVLDNTPRPELTLVTCYPTYWIGPAPGRLIVQAARLP